jgi:hypothetical protein
MDEKAFKFNIFLAVLRLKETVIRTKVAKALKNSDIYKGKSSS